MSKPLGPQLGNYRLLRRIGRTDFAEVYLGEHLHLHTQAAIKVFRVHFTSEDIELLQTEASLIARLVHPHIVRLFDFEVKDGPPFLVMEFAPNGTLRQRHPIGTLVPLDIIVSYAKELAEALNYAHEQGRVHLDIKPENVVLGRNYELLLTDFGIMVPKQRSFPKQTQHMVGTLAYMAPEMIRGHPIPASDQYALAVMVYEWLSGDWPFSGWTIEEMVSQHQSVSPPSLCAKVPTIPTAVEQVLFKALAKDPQQRFANVQAFAMALEEASRSEPSEHPAEVARSNSSVRNLPTGTVTLLFTDIEGSTHLLQQLGADRYNRVLSECKNLLRAVFREWSGHEVDTQGDAFFVVFARATDAVLAAAEAQRVLFGHSWPEGVAVRVRMGIHTGEPQRSSDGYVGLDVHRAARIMSAGHGGQVLLSQTTCNLVEQDLPDDMSLLDLGEHRLKDLGRARRIFQLVVTGLPAEFPPLKTLNSSPNNLPVQPTPFLGREHELVAVEDLLRREDVRLVTLTGPGGSGKTRLGLQVAAELSDLFPDGVFFVNLASTNDPALVVTAIVETLGIRENAGQSLMQSLQEALRQKQMLLLLDNFEQVISAAEHVAALLGVCLQLKVLVTSREVLHVRAEHEFTVPPLALPDPRHLPDLATLTHYASVALFLQRAQAVKPDFQLTDANARAIAEICTRLDGLPLAIELAAARIKLLSPQALLARLDQRLSVLTSGARDAPARQQALRNTIKWSYDLLNTQEQQLFRRLSVFAGGCTLEAIEVVCHDAGDEKVDVLNIVASLIDKSLLRQIEQEGEEPRFGMLETIREYGLETLAANGEVESTRKAHAVYHLKLAEEAEPGVRGPRQVLWHVRLDRERGNLLEALEWFIASGETESALRLSGALWWYWYSHGRFSEILPWLKRTLAMLPVGEHTAVRAKVLQGAGLLMLFQREDAATTQSLLEETVAIYQELGEKRELALSLIWLQELYIVNRRDYQTARSLLEQSIALAREVEDKWVQSGAAYELAQIFEYQGDYAAARTLYQEAITLSHEVGDRWGLTRPLFALAYLDVEVQVVGDYTRAAALAQECLALAREMDDMVMLPPALVLLGKIARLQGDYAQSESLLREGLRVARETGDWSFNWCLLNLADTARLQDDYAQAESLVQEGLRLARERVDQFSTAQCLALLGDIAYDQGHYAQATADFNEAFSLFLQLDSREGLGVCLRGLARVAHTEGQVRRAVYLFAAATARMPLHVDLAPIERAEQERILNDLRERLGEESFSAAWAEGRSMTPEQALAAQKPWPVSEAPVSGPPPTPPVKASVYNDGLTLREVEVLRLVAQGMTDAQVAETLVISPRTVNWHLTSIYSKLQISSRSAATRYAIEHHLV